MIINLTGITISVNIINITDSNITALRDIIRFYVGLG